MNKFVRFVQAYAVPLSVLGAGTLIALSLREHTRSQRERRMVDRETREVVALLGDYLHQWRSGPATFEIVPAR
jgi:hypothetical protein